AEMNANKKVELIGETGGPKWSRWLFDRAAQARVERDGFYTLHSADLGMLELARSVPFSSYRFTARIRHSGSEKLGLVGVYFADQAVPVDGGEAHFFCQVEYDDINRGNDSVVKVPVQHPPGKVQSLLGNEVHFKGMVVADFGQPKIWGQEADDFQFAH